LVDRRHAEGCFWAPLLFFGGGGRLLCAGAAALAAVLALSACGQGASPRASEEVSFRSEDGVDLAGTLRRPATASPTGLILVHGAGGTRDDWAVFGERVRRAGYMTLALDMRGHGGSRRQGEKELDHRRFSTEEWLGSLEDIAAARRLLVARGVDADNIAVIGAGLGANLALHYLLRDTLIQAAVLISPGLDYEGIGTEAAMRGLKDRPVLLLASEGDAYSAASTRTLKAAAAGFCELRSYPGAAQGTDLLAALPNATDQIVQWLDTILGRASIQKEEASRLRCGEWGLFRRR